MVLVKKWPFFQHFFWGNIAQKTIFYDILERKIAFRGYKNKTFKKSKNWHFSKGVNHGFSQKMAISTTFFFLGTIAQENVFYDVLKRKNTFLGYKNQKFKKSENWIFPKGLTHGFGPKKAIFPTFFLGTIGQENVFYKYSKTKKHLSRL